MSDVSGGGGRRLSHGWKLSAPPSLSPRLISRFIRPSVRAIPPAMARQIGCCHVRVAEDLGRATIASRWSLSGDRLEIEIAAADRKQHDVALELLLCVGQALWTRLTDEQTKALWVLLSEELREETPGEIDEDALQQKKALLASRVSAASRRRLERYAAAAFAGTAAEYVHCLWHDVSIRCGPDFLPAKQLRRRLELLSRWYPPSPGHKLFARK